MIGIKLGHQFHHGNSGPLISSWGRVMQYIESNFYISYESDQVGVTGTVSLHQGPLLLTWFP